MNTETFFEKLDRWAKKITKSKWAPVYAMLMFPIAFWIVAVLSNLIFG